MTNSITSSQSAQWGDESHVVAELKWECGAGFGSVGLLDGRCQGREAPWPLLPKHMVWCSWRIQESISSHVLPVTSLLLECNSLMAHLILGMLFWYSEWYFYPTVVLTISLFFSRLGDGRNFLLRLHQTHSASIANDVFFAVYLLKAPPTCTVPVDGSKHFLSGSGLFICSKKNILI